MGTSTTLDKYMLCEENDSPVPVWQGLGRHAAHGGYSVSADAAQYIRFTAHGRLICKQTAVSSWICSLGLLSIWESILLPQKHRKYLSHQTVFPYEIWDWIVYTTLCNTGSSLLSSTILAVTDVPLWTFQS